MVNRDSNGRLVKGHSINTGRTLSEEHKQNISKSHIGKHYPKLSEARKNQYRDKTKHPMWKGGVTPLNKLLRVSSMWKIWREAVFLRDNFTCQNKDCEFCNNEIGVMLHPHHIKQVSLFPELVFNINNGITYCADYHLKSGMHKGILKVKI